MLSRRRFTGLSLINGALLGLLAFILVLGGVILYRSMNEQKEVARSFESWLENAKGYQEALRVQAQTRKPILLYFYATWCPHCKDFAANVLAKPEMQAFVKNYPHVRVAPDNGQAEQKLMSEFGAEGYPTFYVVLPSQKPVMVDTFTLETNPPRPKTAAEFIQSIQAVLK
ncbi:thioredoxin family protein [Vampirovibrio chlorellavorus]|uniref:thioredoxin family protein n=1 Tax=Vampirovibrio chlorellavorus TaxID=758823 RepID=UPI0026EE8C44|nr:thioredoxin family protein [Vampirovibrio chlorellavorus]